MGRNFTRKISISELEEKIKEASMRNREPGEEEDYSLGEYFQLTADVEKDLSKVEFDTENVTDSASELFGHDYIGNPREYVGYHTLENGLSFLGVQAGGDWEFPIFFIVYYDGKKLRGYIPKEGNTWNTKTKSALGNYEEEDEKFAKSKGWTSAEDAIFDYNKMEGDILSRIQYMGP